jgi:hypothetical protein
VAVESDEGVAVPVGLFCGHVAHCLSHPAVLLCEFPVACRARFIQLVNGRHTIQEIAALVARDGSPQPGAADVENLARNVFQNRWRLDFLAMARTPSSLDD